MPSQSLKKMASMLLLVLLAAAQPVWGAAPESVREAQVTYVSADRIFLSAGRRHGVQSGDELTLERNHERVARVRIEQVSDISAAGIVIEQKRPLRVGDMVQLPGTGTVDITTPPTAPTPETTPLNWSDARLATEWTDALVDTPPTLVIYHRSPTATSAIKRTLGARVGTELHQYSYFQDSRYLQTEQSIRFSAHGENQWFAGFGWTIDGTAIARYDNNDDLYLSGQRFIPLIRNLSISYRSPRHPFVAVLGRFVPDAPMVHTIDGIAAALETRQFDIALFGGFQPDEQNLAFNARRQSIGAAARITPGRTRVYTMEAGLLAKLYEGKFYRTALGLNNRIDHKSGFHLTETTIVDFLSAKNDTTSQGKVTLSTGSIDAVWPLTARLQMDASARYNRDVLFTEDYGSLPQTWITSVERAGQTRLEVGAPFETKRKNQLRPFLFGRGELDPNGFDRGLGGAGFTFHDDTLHGSRTGITTTFDYGIGKGQIANIDVTFNTPLQNSRLNLLCGLYTTWNWVYRSDVHTLRNLAFLLLQGHVRKNIDITANWQTGYDHALVRLTYPLGVWMQFQMGMTAWF